MDLTVPHGDTRTFALTITAGGAPLSLTGKTLRFAAARTIGATPVITHATGSGIVHDPDQSANRGKAVLTLVPDDTSSLPNVRAVLAWGVQVEDGTQRYLGAEGRLEITPDAVVGP